MILLNIVNREEIFVIKFIEFKESIFLEPRESYLLEFKKSKIGLSKDLWETYSSFANTSGGIIVLGIEEDKTNKNYKIVGVDNPERIISDFWNCIHDKQKVSANLLTNDDVLLLKVDGKTIIQIRVPKAPFEKRPVYVSNNRSKTYIRTDDGDRLANDEQFKYLVVDSQNDIDSEVLDNYDINDINMESVEAYKQIVYKNTNDAKYLEFDNYTFLCNMGVFKRDRQIENAPYKLTAGGLLFFGKYNSITDRFKKFQLDYFKKKSSLDTDWQDRVSSGDMNFPEMNIYSFYNIVLQKLEQGIPDKYVQTKELNRGSFKSDLMLALKEALVNSLMHAYFDSDKVIKINDFGDYVEFYNPGEMKVSKEEFIHGSYSVTRNSIIATLFRRAGIAEKGGSGGPRIFDAATKNHLRLPDVNTDFESTEIKIWKIDMLESLKGLTEIEREIVSYAMDNGTFKIKDIVENTEYTDYKVRQTVTELVEKGYLLESGQGRARVYLLSHSEETGIMSFKRLLKQIEDGFIRGK